MRTSTMQEQMEAQFMGCKALLLETIAQREGYIEKDVISIEPEEANKLLEYAEFLFNMSHKGNQNVNSMTEREIFRAFIT